MEKRFIPSRVLVPLFTLSVFAPVSAEDWPQWRGPNRDGKSAETGIIRSWEEHPPKLLWMTEGMGGGYSSVAVVDGKVFTTGNLPDGQGVIAVDAADGKVLWSEVITDKIPKHGYGGARSAPSVDGDLLYVTTSDGTIACLTTDGKKKWQKEFKKEWDGKMMSGWGFAESPLVDGDNVICTPGGPKAMMVALDKRTGRTKWKARMEDIGPKGKDGAGYGSVVVTEAGGVRQYVQMTGRGVIGVRADDGEFLWGYNKVANQTANIPSPVVAGQHILASTGYGTGSALIRLKQKGRDEVSAEEVYFLAPKTLQNHHGGLILHNGYIFAGHGHNNGMPICLDIETGEVMWGPEKGVGHGSAAITYADGHLIFRYQSGHVALIEATEEAYRLKGSFMPEHQEKESWAHPVISGGKLYLREQDKLMCYQL